MPRRDPLHVQLDHTDPRDLDRALAAAADAVRTGEANVLVLDVGPGDEAPRSSVAQVFLSWHHRHAVTLRENVDALAYVATSVVGYVYLRMFCFGVKPACDYAVFRSRERALAWAREKAEAFAAP